MYTLHYLSRAVEAVLEALVVPLVILLAAVLVIAAAVEIRHRWRRRRPQTVTKAAERRARAGAPRRDHRRGCQGCERRNACIARESRRLASIGGARKGARLRPGARANGARAALGGGASHSARRKRWRSLRVRPRPASRPSAAGAPPHCRAPLRPRAAWLAPRCRDERSGIRNEARRAGHGRSGRPKQA